MYADNPQVGEVVRGLDKTLGYFGFESFFKAPSPRETPPQLPARGSALSPREVIQNKRSLMSAQSAPAPLPGHKRLHGESCGCV